MSQLPAVTGKELVAALQQFGFEILRIKGSHHFMRHPDGRTTVVPVHAGEDIGPGLMSKILRDTRLTRQELKSNLTTGVTGGAVELKRR